MGGKAYTVSVVGDEMTVIAQGENPRRTCCSLQQPMIRLGDSKFWALRFRLRALDRAHLSMMVFDQVRPPTQEELPAHFNGRFEWQGPNAPPPHREVLPSESKGILQDAVIDSAALGEKRKLQVWLPPGWSRDKTWPVAIIGDGHVEVYTGFIEAMIEDGRIEPMIVIGAYSGWQALVDADPALEARHGDLRQGEYVPGFGPPGRYEAHLAFIADEVTAWASRAFNASTRREDRLIAGQSSGGAMALFAGLHRPDVFGFAVPLSPAGRSVKPEEITPGVRASFHMSGGLYEPGFALIAKGSHAVLKNGGYDVVTEYPSSGHFQEQWALVLGNAVLRFFPKQ